MSQTVFFWQYNEKKWGLMLNFGLHHSSNILQNTFFNDRRKKIIEVCKGKMSELNFLGELSL